MVEQMVMPDVCVLSRSFTTFITCVGHAPSASVTAMPRGNRGAMSKARSLRSKSYAARVTQDDHKWHQQNRWW